MPKSYSLPEAADVLGIPDGRVHYAVVTGRISPLKAGRSRILSEADLVTLRTLFAKRDAADSSSAVATGRAS